MEVDLIAQGENIMEKRGRLKTKVRENSVFKGPLQEEEIEKENDLRNMDKTGIFKASISAAL